MRIERVVPWRKQIAARDARSAWTSRHGWLVVVSHAGVRGIGECSPLPGFGGTHAAALRFALETAVLDALARARGIPLAATLVANPGTRIPLNALVTHAGAAAAALARGITTLKVKVGPELAFDPSASHVPTTARSDREPHDRARQLDASARGTLDPRRLDAIIAAAPGARLRLDANQTWPLAEVPARLAALASLPIDYVEEPSAGIGPWLASQPSTEPPTSASRGAARSAHVASPPRVALDESLADPRRDEWLDRALAGGAVAALILKPTILGGFAACAALAARARAHGVAAVVTHALEGPVGTAACASLALALTSNESSVPVGLDRHATLDAWSTDVPHLTPSHAVLPGAPGLGLDIDAVLAAAEAS